VANGPEYKIERIADVDEQIRALVQEAAAAGAADTVFQALDTMLEQLKTKPLRWGDPQFRTRKKGGLVLRAICEPLIVRYAVFGRRRLCSYWG
jgi:hypothetical protein